MANSRSPVHGNLKPVSFAQVVQSTALARKDSPRVHKTPQLTPKGTVPAPSEFDTLTEGEYDLFLRKRFIPPRFLRSQISRMVGWYRAHTPVPNGQKLPGPVFADIVKQALTISASRLEQFGRRKTAHVTAIALQKRAAEQLKKFKDSFVAKHPTPVPVPVPGRLLSALSEKDAELASLKEELAALKRENSDLEGSLSLLSKQVGDIAAKLESAQAKLEQPQPVVEAAPVVEPPQVPKPVLTKDGLKGLNFVGKPNAIPTDNEWTTVMKLSEDVRVQLNRDPKGFADVRLISLTKKIPERVLFRLTKGGKVASSLAIPTEFSYLFGALNVMFTDADSERILNVVAFE